LSTTRTAMPSS